MGWMAMRYGYLRTKKNPLFFFKLLLVTASLTTFFVGLYFKDQNSALIGVATMWIYAIITYWQRETVNLLAFMLTFFTFLLGNVFLSQIDNIATGLLAFDIDIIIHTYVCLYLGIAFTYIGYLIAKQKKYRLGTYHFDVATKGNTNTQSIRTACKWLYMLTALCAILAASEKVIFYKVAGDYSAYYTSFSSALPGFITRIAECNAFVFFFYLATLPDPRKSKLILGSYFFVGLLGLLYGQRNQIIMAIIMIVLYIIMYENFADRKYSIIKRKHYFIALILIPFILLFLDFYMYYREGRAYNFTSIIDSLKNLMKNLGGSVNVIAYGRKMADQFPMGKLYSFGGVIDFLTKNVLVKSIFGTEIYHDQTVQMALNGNSFGQTITYLVYPQAYIAGHGMGSCYLAEAFHDFGYFGVAIFSMVYGYILSKANRLIGSSVVRNAILLISVYQIIYSPRAEAGSFLSAYFNFSFIGTVLIIYILASSIKKRTTRFDQTISKEKQETCKN